MLERPGYTGTDPNQLRISWEMACIAEAEILPDRNPGNTSDGFLNHMASVIDRRFGTDRARQIHRQFD